MSHIGITRKLKRQASSDIEEGPVKQARTTAHNAYTRPYSPLRRSETQALDINATIAEVKHLPHACGPVPAPPRSELQSFSKQGKDQTGSTDEESQDENSAWDIRAKVYRHNMLFKQPHEPASKLKRPRPALLIQDTGEVALMESDSEDEQSLESANPYGISEAASRKTQQLLALRAARATAPKRPQISATVPTNSVQAFSANTVTTTTRTASRSSVITTNAVAGSAHLRESHSMTGLRKPELQSKDVRQNAIDIIAGHCSTAVPSVLSTSAPTLSIASSLSSMPSQILRRSRRIATRQQN